MEGREEDSSLFGQPRKGQNERAGGRRRKPQGRAGVIVGAKPKMFDERRGDKGPGWGRQGPGRNEMRQSRRAKQMPFR
jgi:hypothetical protein